MLILIQKWCKNSQAQPSWLDKFSFQSVSERLFSLYTEQAQGDTLAFLEVTLPDFGMPVLCEDQVILGLRHKYHFPPY